MATFKSDELAGWTNKAANYDDHFAVVTRQTVEPAIKAAGGVAGCDVLDICCGTGDLSAACLDEGARVTGVDFAAPMVEIAARKVPRATFVTGDAEALDLPDNSFDTAICLFGLWHLPEPDKAFAEAGRVLRPGGTYVFSVWLPPEEGWDLLDILMTAIKQHGTLDVDLPAAPPPFRFAVEDEARRSLEALGFGKVQFTKHVAIWTGKSGQAVLDLMYKSVVRAPMLVEAQEPKARDAINREIVEKTEATRKDGRISMRWPYALISAKVI